MKERDLRKYSRQTFVRLIIGAVLVLLIIGEGLIYLIYGSGAALTGLLCLLGALVPIALIFLFLNLMEWVVKRANRD